LRVEFFVCQFCAGFFGETGDVLFGFGHGGAQRFIGFERRNHQFRCVTASWLATSVAPSNFSVNSSNASSPRTWTASRMARVRCSMTGSNRQDGARYSPSFREKSASL